jgi:DNA repair protein RadC
MKLDNAITEIQRLSAGEHVDDAVIMLARNLLTHRFQLKRPSMNSPKCVRDYLTLKLSELGHEVFCAVFLDAQNRVIECEVVKRALHHNAAGVIFAHNHPSGVCEPSRSDEALTQALKQALALVDVKVLDHFVIGSGAAMSFAERGLL